MHHRKERALALLTGNGIGVVLATQAVLEALKRGCELFAGPMALQAGFFGLGLLVSYFALGAAASEELHNHRFRIWEGTAISLFAIFFAFMTLAGFTGFDATRACPTTPVESSASPTVPSPDP